MPKVKDKGMNPVPKAAKTPPNVDFMADEEESRKITKMTNAAVGKVSSFTGFLKRK